MAHLRLRTHLIRTIAAAGIGACAIGVAATTGPPRASADDVAYLVNVTVHPAINFPNADAALGYGRGICDKIAHGRPYRDIMADVKADLGNPDEYPASYLITQAANELCPALIYQLRNSAAGYQPHP